MQKKGQLMKKFYSCRYDRTFKEVFLNSKNEDLLKALLEDILKVKIEIKKILPTELIVGNNIIKSKRVDALILTTNKKIEIEINASINEYVYIRNTAYICNVYLTNALDGNVYVKNLLIMEINMEYYKEIGIVRMKKRKN